MPGRGRSAHRRSVQAAADADAPPRPDPLHGVAPDDVGVLLGTPTAPPAAQSWARTTDFGPHHVDEVMAGWLTIQPWGRVWIGRAGDVDWTLDPSGHPTWELYFRGANSRTSAGRSERRDTSPPVAGFVHTAPAAPVKPRS